MKGCKQDITSQHDYFTKGLYVFFTKNKLFSYEWILKQFILQLVIINVYNCPSTWQKINHHFWINMNFWKCPNSL
jgi:hypothetical protein